MQSFFRNTRARVRDPHHSFRTLGILRLFQADFHFRALSRIACCVSHDILYGAVQQPGMTHDNASICDDALHSAIAALGLKVGILANFVEHFL